MRRPNRPRRPGGGVAAAGRRSLRAAIVLVAAATFATCGEKATAPPSGEELYLAYCASCHGWDGRGDGPVVEVLERQPSDLTRLAARGHFDEANLVEIIDGRRVVPAHGTRQMPVWGPLFESDLERGEATTHRTARLRAGLIIDHLRSIQEEEP